ncbi:MAG: SRPBCC domain-containing protein [Bacteroidota bacterium]
MKSIQTEIIINAPREKVWQLLTDFKNYPTWNTFIVSIEGELKEGGRLKNKMVVDGKRQTFRPKIQKVIPNEYLEWLGKVPLGMFNGQHYFQLETVGNGQTKLTHGEYFSGWLRGMIMKKIGAATRRGFIKMNEELKKLAEG